MVAGSAVATLDTPIPFAYAVDRAGDRLVVSNLADSIAPVHLEVLILT